MREDANKYFDAYRTKNGKTNWPRPDGYSFQREKDLEKMRREIDMDPTRDWREIERMIYDDSISDMREPSLAPSPVKEVRNVTIEEIHNEFDAVQNELLKEAKAILKGLKGTHTEKRRKLMNALRSKGFVRSKSITDHEDAEEEYTMSNNVARMIDYFATQYPTYKFISEDKIKEICGKYGLVFGNTEWFTGEIPDANIEDLAKFKLAAKDNVIGYHDKRDHMHGSGGWRTKTTTTHFVECNTETVKNDVDNFKTLPSLIKDIENGDAYGNGINDHYILKPFSIVGNRELFDMNGKEVENFEVTSSVTINLPDNDPIVIAPVNTSQFGVEGAGFLIVTKWGDEAEIVEVQDAKLN